LPRCKDIEAAAGSARHAKSLLDRLVCAFSYGGLPHDDRELNLRLFADQVRPVLQRDSLFTRPPEIVTELPAMEEETVFVPG
jgi:hypothetical protein